MLTKIKIAIFFAIVLAIVAAGGTIQTLRARVAAKTTEIEFLSSDNREKDLKISVLSEQILEIDKKYREILAAKDAAAQSLSALQEKFDKVNRDWGLLLAAKPGLTEKIMTKATADRWRCFEIATGAEKTKNEKNSVCSELLGDGK